MSDPVTNVEIEDVLESIRRLVAAGDTAAPVPPHRAQPRQDRLVLTPAFRVDCTDHGPGDTEQAARPDADRASDLDETTTTVWDTPADREDERPTSLDTGTLTPDGTKEANGESGTGPDDVDRLLAQAMAKTLPLSARTLEPSERRNPALPEAAGPALEWEDVSGDPSEVRHPSTARPAERNDDQSATAPDAPPAAEGADGADMAAAAEVTEEEAEDTRLWHSSRTIRQPDAPAIDPDPQTAPDASTSRPDDRATRRSDLEATIAELEAAVTFSAQDFEPDDPDTGIASPASGRLHLVVTGDLDPQDDAGRDAAAHTAATSPEEPETAAPPQDEPPSRATTAPRFRVYPGSVPPRDTDPESGPQDNHIAARPELDDDAELAAYLEDEGVIDEEALRDLVGQIVREELQGVLGERITRNVRKLVRREIHRILSSQDFD